MQINRLTRDELDQYEALLNSETVDIFGWITDKNPLPAVQVVIFTLFYRKWTYLLFVKFNNGLRVSHLVQLVLKSMKRTRNSSPINNLFILIVFDNKSQNREMC